jgi:hypothetical protein
MLPQRHTAVIVLCNRTGESLPRTRMKIMAMLSVPLRENISQDGTAIPLADFAKYAGTYRNGESTVRILERDGKLIFRQMELRKGDGGWLILKTAEGTTGGRVFAVYAPDGSVEYLHTGGRSSVRSR